MTFWQWWILHEVLDSIRSTFLMVALNIYPRCGVEDTMMTACRQCNKVLYDTDFLFSD